MTQTAHVVGEVAFRPGDGPLMPIPPGPIEVRPGSTEVTLSWADGDARGAATMPIREFSRYVADGAIRLDA
ncbi:hypothetical protein ABXN37_23770 [Piscinibacter sakaiensis]|uniref:Uncharacterized protein n=1 Tax=Piscinibacter sakaiensis TaxID=1547922 RepID=A0A0K8P657_PISS1|nr:hypothetical protein [Piscinibacter sakaiensis]GAP38148.1 hypothetical protein ISF6_4342 [Piscinibacter sakaiensis]